MRFNCGADLRPTRGIDPDTAILYSELCGGWIFRKFWHSRRARFPFFVVDTGDEFCKTGGDERRCVGFTIALHWRVQELRYAMQNVNSAIFRVPAETYHRGNVEIEFPKRLRQTVRGPILFLARNPGPRAEVADQVGLGENDSRRAIDFRCRWIAARIGEVGDCKPGI